MLGRLLRREPVDPVLVYCRATPVFEAPEGPYFWLTRHIFVASAQRYAGGCCCGFS